MASTTAFCTSAKEDYLRGENDAADTYKIALFTSSATNDATTTVYAVTNEISGTGYTAGGVTLSGYASSTSGTTAFLDWTSDPQWTGASFTAASALIYNSSNSDASKVVLDFGGDQTVSSGTFTIQFPTADASNAIIRMA